MKTLMIILYLSISIISFAPTCQSQLLNEQVNHQSQMILSNIELNQFLCAMQLQETWDTTIFVSKGSALSNINHIGAMGLWQFMPKTLRGLGYKGSFYKFLHSGSLQREYMVKLLKQNKLYLDKYLPEWQSLIGTVVRGVPITYSGLLAALHFAGIGGLKNFLKYGKNASDGNSTIVHYLDKFQGYEFGLLI